MIISAKELKEQSGSLNVLYAEDEEILRESMQSTLSKLFKKVYVAKNGQEAFEIFKKENIDLVITDINMPIMSGVELIQTIHQYTDQEVYITVLSAHNDSRLLTGLINLGINSFLNKPVDKQLLINSLYKVCSTINDKKLILTYEQQLHSELEAINRKNKILEQKLNQLAKQTNLNLKKTSQSEPVKKETPSTTTQSYFDVLLLDDKDELRDLSNELDNYITMLFQSENLNEDYLEKLANVYKKYATVLNGYPEFFEIAAFLLEFSATILTLESKFMENIQQTGIYFESLQLTLENYRENIWNKEAKDPKFYNASLINDIELVINFLQNKEVEENEIEFF